MQIPTGFLSKAFPQSAFCSIAENRCWLATSVSQDWSFWELKAVISTKRAPSNYFSFQNGVRRSIDFTSVLVESAAFPLVLCLPYLVRCFYSLVKIYHDFDRHVVHKAQVA